MTPGKWRDIMHNLNKIAQLSRDSKNAEEIARKVDHLRRTLQGKPPKGKKGHSFRRVTFDTNCPCGHRMTVTVTFGNPPTMRVNEGFHACPVWPAACKLIIDRARRVK